MLVELALPGHAREAEARLPLRVDPRVLHPKVEPGAASLFILRALGVFRHGQLPRAVARPVRVLQVAVVEIAAEDEAVLGVVRERRGRRAVHFSCSGSLVIGQLVTAAVPASTGALR